MRRLLASLALAAAACAAPAPQPAAVDEAATPQGAGRIMGAFVGVATYGEFCVEALPGRRVEIDAAVAHWLWRNAAVAAAVRESFGVSLGETSRVWLDGQFTNIRSELRAWFYAQPEAWRDDYCASMPARLESGRADLRAKYPAEIDAWLRVR